MRKKSLYQVSEIKLVYTSKINIQDRPQIRQSRDAYDIFLNNWSDQLEFIEEFNILLLNRTGRVIGIYYVSKGGHSGTVVDAKVVFSAALKSRAASIIAAHNHPSGGSKPSASDIALTKKLKKAGEYLDIAVLDHLIITPFTYYSFADEGMI
ncbi:MAG: JAB domain-containing protein [Lewinellaceae bacterium]|nr:JAB domain-containing protein [Lewinellaceae bacterium]